MPPSSLSPQFAGMRILESEYLTVDGEPVQVRRSWRERLFSRPWRPLTTTRTVVPQVPNPGLMRIDARTIVLHPETARLFRERFNGQ